MCITYMCTYISIYVYIHIHVCARTCAYQHIQTCVYTEAIGPWKTIQMIQKSKLTITRTTTRKLNQIKNETKIQSSA